MTKTATTKVRISFTVEINLDAYAAEYGVDKSEIRKDLAAYAENTVRAQLDSVGVTAE